MKCPQCQDDMIKAQATDFGDPYDYCRGCKKELGEMEMIEDIGPGYPLAAIGEELERALYAALKEEGIRTPIIGIDWDKGWKDHIAWSEGQNIKTIRDGRGD